MYYTIEKITAMRNAKYLICFFVLAGCLQTGFAQQYKAGDKLEAYLNNTWKEVTVVKTVLGKTNMYQVKLVSQHNRSTATAPVTISNTNLRLPKSKTVLVPVPVSVKASDPGIGNVHIGRYEIYAGVPSMYLGHVILLANGKYKVAFNTDEENYDETGVYRFNNDTNTIEWVAGMFKNNNWGGKLVKKENTYRIEFTSTSFADSSN